MAALGLRFFRDPAVELEVAEERGVTMLLHRESCEDVMSNSTAGLVERLMCVLYAKKFPQGESLDTLQEERQQKQRAYGNMLAKLEDAEANAGLSAGLNTGTHSGTLLASASSNNTEQESAEDVIKRIMSASDDFSILGVSTLDEQSIVKAVKTIRILIHPDKCKLPQARDAWRRVDDSVEGLKKFRDRVREDEEPVMTKCLRDQLFDVREQQVHALQLIILSSDDTDTAKKRAILRTVVSVENCRPEDEVERWHRVCHRDEWVAGALEWAAGVDFECQVINPAGGKPLSLCIPSAFAFLVDKSYPNHKARQKLVHPEFAKLVQ